MNRLIHRRLAQIGLTSSQLYFLVDLYKRFDSDMWKPRLQLSEFDEHLWNIRFNVRELLLFVADNCDFFSDDHRQEFLTLVFKRLTAEENANEN